jgi:hypothetical protein
MSNIHCARDKDISIMKIHRNFHDQVDYSEQCLKGHGLMVLNRATILMTKPIKIELNFESSQITEDLYGC